MRNTFVVVVAIFLGGLLSACAAPEPAELIITNAKIYTMDPARPWASTLVVRDQRIVAIGEDALTGGYRGPVLDLRGRMVLPGMHDAHIHLAYGGRQLSQCELHGLTSVAAIVSQLSRCDADLEVDEWLLGSGWDLSLFAQANPHRAVLDAINPERAMVLAGADGHSTWASSRALALAGIARETPDPQDGVIERDADGVTSGTLREAAQALVRRFVPDLPLDEAIEGARTAMHMAHAVGITSIIEAAATAEDLQVYRALEASGARTVRAVLAIALNDPGLGILAPAVFDLAQRGQPEVLRMDTAKIFVDGVLEGETAALLEPYNSVRGGHGHLQMSPAELTEKVASLHAAGVQILFHAVGDGGVRAALDAVAAAIEQHGRGDARHHISHLQLVAPADRVRFAQLGVTANMQALWAMPDDYITQINLPVVGQHRVDAMYPFGSLSRAGARLAAGSDWTVSSMNPFKAIETAVTRADADGVFPGVLNADEAISLHQALAAYTVEGAYLMHQERDLGVLAEGKLADLIVLDRNLFDVEADAIGETQVLMTLVGGKVVYQVKEEGAPLAMMR